MDEIDCAECGAHYTPEDVTRYRQWIEVDGRRGFFCQDCRALIIVKETLKKA